MKKIFLIGLIAFTASAYAAYTGPAAEAQRMTVKDVLSKAKDDQYVTLTGHIIRKLKKETYVFSDATGQINIDLDDKYLPVQDFNDKTRIEITGKFDKDWRDVEIDVKEVRILP